VAKHDVGMYQVQPTHFYADCGGGYYWMVRALPVLGRLKVGGQSPTGIFICSKVALAAHFQTGSGGSREGQPLPPKPVSPFAITGVNSTPYLKRLMTKALKEIGDENYEP
jgi:hypothetical protein